MEEMYDGLHNYADKALMSPDNLNMMMMIPSDNYVYHGLNIASAATDHQPPFPIFGSDDYMSAAAAGSGSCLNQSFSVISSETASINPEIQKRDYEHEEEEDQENACRVIKSKIASHPSYPKLIDAYLDCQKVGAPPEIGCFLDEMRRENGVIRRESVSSTCLGADPELDYFMETYCDILVKYKSDLSKTFDEAKSFLNNIQFQLGSLSGDNGGGVSSEDDFSGGETEAQDAQMMKGEEDIELKERLFRKYGNHISTLKQEFSKKKKKGKLPKEATKILLEWWNVHYKWPYPTEADKISLAESTRLDQKQINNWFINQRKRHWKPSENMQLAVVDNLSGQFFADD